MEWNNGKERALFEKEQVKLRKEYLAAGMTEEQIKIMYDFDDDWFKKRRSEAMHTQSLDIRTSEDEDNKDSPLLKKFLHSFSVVDKHFENDHFGWIAQIEDKKLYQVIISLPYRDKEILTLLLCGGFTQKEIALQIGMKKSALSRKIGRLKNFLKKFLENVNF